MLERKSTMLYCRFCSSLEHPGRGRLVQIQGMSHIVRLDWQCTFSDESIDKQLTMQLVLRRYVDLQPVHPADSMLAPVLLVTLRLGFRICRSWQKLVFSVISYDIDAATQDFTFSLASRAAAALDVLRSCLGTWLHVVAYLVE